MDSVSNLLILYAGVVLGNTVLSAILWYKEKVDLYKSLFYVWISTLATFFLQGFLTAHSHLVIIYGFSICILIGLSLSIIIEKTANIKVGWGKFFVFQLFAYLLTYILFMNKASFTIMAMPICLSASAPLFYTAIKALLKQFKTLTFTGKGFIYSCLLLGAHEIDFAFFRHRPEFAQLGYTLACLIIFILSIFAFAIVLEYITKEKSRVSAEINVAQRIQSEILPKKPTIPGYELVTYMKPADEVGGDYYDIYDFKDFSWVLLGDVTGHGLGSGLVMFMIQSIMSSILHTKQDISPSELNYIANQILYKNLERLNEKRPTTMVSICLKPDKKITISGCHDNIYLYRAKDDIVETIKLEMFPLGLGFINDLSKELFTEKTFKLNPKDILFIGTDGITEAFRTNNGTEECYTEERLITIFQKNANNSLETIKDKLIQDLDTFTDTSYKDDLTFLIIKAKS
ncbi:hypothetical protein DID77_04270 [Candidatus Marinamargulisbacteria bacterium SCGC AG-439-L15]|nr:hypothetical protein DID77_04270 [Candidatus Marinamargulisbacteria bacterium SCGC AG-439-L15]